MAINISKGQKIDITKGKRLSKLMVGLGWDTNRYSGGYSFDLDAACFMCNDKGVVTDEKHLVFYNNLIGPDSCVEHTGDNLTGEGDGDDEQIKIDLSKIPSNVHELNFTVTIHDAVNRKQNFGQVDNAYVQVYNDETGEVLVRYDLGEDFSVETAIVVAKLYRNGAEWKFHAIGSGFSGGFAALVTNFGLQVQ